jgi:hypothetical protein
MAISSLGFDGSLNEAGFAVLMTQSGIKYSVAGPGDLLVSATPGSRAVSVAAGTAYGTGVGAINSDPIALTIDTPSVGGWYLVVLRRDWADNSITPLVLTGPTTTAATPTTVPSTLPTMESVPGVRDDQKLAWVWANSSTTELVMFDIRAKTVTDALAMFRVSPTPMVAGTPLNTVRFW